MKKARISYRRKKINQSVNLYIVGVAQCFPKSVYKTPFKIKKQIWVDELADADLFTPSCPHLHSSDGKYKLNVYTGKLYDIRLKKILTNKIVREDELKMLWNDHKFLEFAMKMRKLYHEKFSQSELDPIPSYAGHL